MKNLREIEKLLELNKIVCLTGGTKTGKTTICQELAAKANNALLINAILPMSEWVEPGQGKIKERLSQLSCAGGLLVIDNAESITSRKYELVARLMDEADKVVLTCRSYHKLPDRVRARIGNSPIIGLGKDASCVDITYIFIAALICLIALTGNTGSLITLAAMRYMFIGTRGFRG